MENDTRTSSDSPMGEPSGSGKRSTRGRSEPECHPEELAFWAHNNTIRYGQYYQVAVADVIRSLDDRPPIPAHLVAARIVACVNALKGVADPARFVETLVSAVQLTTDERSSYDGYKAAVLDAKAMIEAAGLRGNPVYGHSLGGVKLA